MFQSQKWDFLEMGWWSQLSSGGASTTRQVLIDCDHPKAEAKLLAGASPLQRGAQYLTYGRYEKSPFDLEITRVYEGYEGYTNAISIVSYIIRLINQHTMKLGAPPCEWFHFFSTIEMG
jgi:hypothetical protein